MWVVFASWRWVTVATIKAAAFKDPCGLVPDAQVVVTASVTCVVDGCPITEHRCVTQADRCCGAGVLHGVQWKFVNPIQSCRRVGTIPWANGVTRDATASDIDIGGGVSNQRDVGHRAAISSGSSGVEFPLRDEWRNGKSGAGASEGDATDSDERSLHFNGLWSFLRSSGSQVQDSTTRLHSIMQLLGGLRHYGTGDCCQDPGNSRTWGQRIAPKVTRGH